MLTRFLRYCLIVPVSVVSWSGMLISCRPSNANGDEAKVVKEVGKEAIVKTCTFNHCEINFSYCISKALYVWDEVDLNTYDSIGSYYFEEVKDYMDEEAFVVIQNIKSIEEELLTIPAKHKKKIESLNEELSRLKLALSKFEKEVTGYLFIHTFVNKSDTLSAIIIINEDGTNAQAVPVKTINDVKVDAYAADVKKLNEN
jgi:hypothetical protein